MTEATRGAGRIVLFHVTANADWSNLPLSGLFVDMLRRLVALSAGVADAGGQHRAGARPRRWTASACWPRRRSPRPAWRPNAFGATPVSPRHPPGLYGPENGRQALNLGADLPLPQAAPTADAARTVEDFAARGARSAPVGPWLLAAALALLALDLLIALGLRGLLRPLVAAVALAALLAAARWWARWG